MAAKGYVALRSSKLGTLGPSIGDIVSWDIKLPTQQANPWWFGTSQLYVEIPSLGMYNAFVGQVELTGLPPAQWRTLSLKLPDYVLGKLRGEYSDLVLTVVVNVPYNAPGSYLLDNLRFSSGTEVCVVPVAECVVSRPQGDPVQVVFGYRSCLTGSATDLPVGPKNQISPGADDQGQPTRFLPGRHRAQFQVTLDGAMAVWTLGKNEALAGRFLPECTPECVAHLFDPNASRPGPGTVVPPAGRLSRDESLNIRRSFSWSETTPVPETGANQTPLLYQAQIYLATRGDHDLLDAMRIHYDSMPIFGQERDELNQIDAPSSYSHDGQGQFVFAIVPGAIYNAIRSAAIDPNEPDEMFPVVQMRDIPAGEARADCGLAPLAECVVDRGAGRFTAVFGYNNPAGGVVTVPIGSDNLLSSAVAKGYQPEVFASGDQRKVFAVDFTGSGSARWTLNGRTATATSASTRCPESVLASVGGERVPVPVRYEEPGDFDCRAPTPNEVAYPQSRLPPAARANTCGTVNYDHLGKYGFKWRGLAPGERDTAAEAAEIRVGLLPDAPTNLNAKSLRARRMHAKGDIEVGQYEWSIGKFVRKCVKKVASKVASTIDLIGQGLNQVARLFVGSREVTIEIRLKNGDGDHSPPGDPTDMVQAWGHSENGFGSGLKIKGATVRAAKWVFLSKGTLGDDNKAKVRVLNGADAEICITVANDAAALMSGWFIPHDVCSFVPPNGGKYKVPQDGGGSYTVDVQADYVNVLAQLTDGKKYMQKVAGFDNQQAEVIIGSVANLIGDLNKNRGFAPCLALDGGALSIYDLLYEMHLQIGQVPRAWIVGELSSKVKTDLASAGKARAKTRDALDAMRGVFARLSARFPGNTDLLDAARTTQDRALTADNLAAAFITEAQALDRAQQAAATAKAAADAAVGKPDAATKKQLAETAARDLQGHVSTASTAGGRVVSALADALAAYTLLNQRLAGLDPGQEVRDGLASTFQNLSEAKSLLQDTVDDFAKVAGKAGELLGSAVAGVVLTCPLVLGLGELFEILAAGDIVLPESAPLVCEENPTPPTGSFCPPGKNTIPDCPPPPNLCYRAGDTPGFPTGRRVLGNDPQFRQNVRGRGVATHEYGHFTLCNLIQQTAGQSAFRKAYGAAAVTTLLHPDDSSYEAAYINDGFADLFASEVIGGTSYPDLVSERPLPEAQRSNVGYCTDAGDNCFEDNIGAPASRYQYNPASPSFDDEVARVLTTIHDAFDRWPVVNIPTPNQSYPAQVTVWSNAGGDTVAYAGNYAASQDDDAVWIQGNAWPKIVRNMIDPSAPALVEDRLMRGLNTVMRDAGWNWCTRCEVFRNHTPTRTCPSKWMDQRPTGMECEWENCVPPKKVFHDKYRLCAPECPDGYHFEPEVWKCVPDPPTPL